MTSFADFVAVFSLVLAKGDKLYSQRAVNELLLSGVAVKD